MKPTAALKQRIAFRGEIGFCRTKLAPSSKARWVVVVPFRTAKATEFLLLLPLRRLSRTSRPPCRSSQSTMTPSNFSDRRISLPDLAPRHTSTSMESFSNVGRSTPMTCASRLTSRDCSGIQAMVTRKTHAPKVTKVMELVTERCSQTFEFSAQVKF